MTSNFERFKGELDQALGLVETSEMVKSLEVPQISAPQIVDAESLLARCDQICDSFTSRKPMLRIIHHIACSGGTLVSKCISALPNVYLLSEVHPFTELGLDKNKPKYSPTDIVSLVKYAGVPNSTELAADLFKSSIKHVDRHVTRYGGTLVLREHTHADYFTRATIPKSSPLIELLKTDYEIESVFTVRDPLESYTSLQNNGWLHFEPNDFREYCRRLLLCIKQFDRDRVFRYEDFVAEPSLILGQISAKLQLPFDDGFEDIFGLFKVTGDSGRTSDTIEIKTAKVSEDLLMESKLTDTYQEFIQYMEQKI
ncbi:hypothetical protein EXU30_03530 [Shewanella maritima]|uniref:Sulfotransferase family protein n=1 Tax=Shewanella maritima TaxID=2520507 RepID=A0A411PEH5_9GAMM|nr:hypothetical protein [Shewanella maritima]QBF81872.1 hypothetical protein EXU30_03530 [Shewanella maritima]